MASDTLEKMQLDAGVGHPGQRRVSQAVPNEAGQPKIINQLVPHPVASRRIAVGSPLHDAQPVDEHPWLCPPSVDPALRAAAR
jgi:hypothetical protein